MEGPTLTAERGVQQAERGVQQAPSGKVLRALLLFTAQTSESDSPPWHRQRKQRESCSITVGTTTQTSATFIAVTRTR